MSPASCVARAGRWFLDSGIQDSQGGVARFYRADLQQNRPVSTEITGYTASALIYLFRATGDEHYLDRARLTVAFLRDQAWDPKLQIFPYEYPSPSAASAHRAYFFDSGIIVRGLIAVWRETGEESLVGLATAASHGMLRDFTEAATGEFYPILELPSKVPAERSGYWSSSSACYQTKAALAWWELSEITGDRTLRDAYLQAIEQGLATHAEFLASAGTRAGVMDRLHAYNYFLEALSPMLGRAECWDAYQKVMTSIAAHLRDIAPVFARSDVYAQLLRARLFAGDVDEHAAEEEATALYGFQLTSDDKRLDGGFCFGQRDGQLVPHANPVSTAFALQALHLWKARAAGENNPCGMPPI